MKDRILSHPFSIVASAVLLCAVVSPELIFGQVTYSYKDDTGVLVLTNIAPNRPVTDLKVYGLPAPVPRAAGAAATPSAGSTKNNRRGPQLSRSINADSNDRNSVQPSAAGQTAGMSARAAQLRPLIDKYATQFRLDPELVRSVIATESGFQERAVSSKGALGLMQLMPSTAAQLGVWDPFDPEQNIRGGTKHLRFLMDTFNNDLPLSLAAYNAGENLVQRLGRIPDIRETHNYVRSVTARYGDRRMKTVLPSQPPTRTVPSVFRYLDENGVLVLTNIPPVGTSTPAAGPVQSPQ